MDQRKPASKRRIPVPLPLPRQAWHRRFNTSPEVSGERTLGRPRPTAARLGGALLRLDPEFLEARYISEPRNRSTSTAHPRCGFDKAAFERPKTRFVRHEVHPASPAHLSLNQFRVPAHRANLPRFIHVLVAVEHLHHRVEVFLPKTRRVAHLAIGDFAFAHPSVKRGLADIQVISRFADREPMPLSIGRFRIFHDPTLLS